MREVSNMKVNKLICYTLLFAGIILPLILCGEAFAIIRILETPSVAYTSIQTAYNAASSGNTIQCKAITLSETLNLNRDISISIEGGYNSDFSQQTTQKTLLIGMINSTQGTISMENISVSFDDPQNIPETPILNSADALDTKVHLSWNTASGAEGYIVKYGTSSGTYSNIIYVEFGTTHIVTGLSNNTMYYFVLSAYNGYGESGNSNESSATPQPREATIGHETVYGSISTDASLMAVPVTMSEEGTVKSISIYHEGGSGTVVLGLYAGVSSPQNRLAVTADTAVNATAGWQKIDLTNVLHIESSTQVWMTIMFSNNPGIRYTAGSPQAHSTTETYASLGGQMPATFPSSSGNGAVGSIYITYIQNQEPSIIEFIPANGVKYQAEDIVTLSVTAEDSHYDPMEYQYSINDVVQQSWSSSNSYQWATQSDDFDEHTIKVEVRDDIGAKINLERDVFIVHKPKEVE